MKRFLILSVVLLTSVAGLRAQNTWALKTNLLSDVTTTPNIAYEFAIAPRWTIETSFSANLWPLGHINFRHASVQPELRYWFCDRFNGAFISINAVGGYIYNLGGIYNFSKIHPMLPNLLDDSLQEAILIGGGLSVGTDIVLSRHWNLEMEVGIGYMYVKGHEFRNGVEVQGNFSTFDYIGPNRLSLALVYLF